MKTLLELQEFFIEGKARDTSHVLLHITEPSTPKEFEVGYFFAIAEIEQGSIEHISHVQSLIDDLESGIYESTGTSNKSSFELTLEFINRRGQMILGFEGTTHILVGVIHGNDIAFAYHGSPTALLMYKTEQGFESLNILDTETNSSEQLFSAVMEGSMNNGDAFFVSTPRVNSILSEEKLTKFISLLSPKEATTEINAAIKEANTKFSYGGIIFQSNSLAEAPMSGPKPKETEVTSKSSMDTLHNAEAKTSAIMRPSILKRNQKPAEAKHARTKRNNHSEMNYRPRAGEDEDLLKTPLGNQILVILGKSIVTVLRWSGIVIAAFLIFLRDIIVNIFLLATNARGQRHNVQNKIKRSFADKKRLYTSLPIISKVLLLATIIVAFIFITSIFLLRAKEQKQIALTSYTQTLQAITDKKDAAEASLIYNDATRAFELLREADVLTQALPDKTDEQQTTKENLTTQIETVFSTIRKITTVQTSVVASISESYPTALASHLTRIDNILIAYGAEDNTHYAINMDTGKLDSRDHSTIPSLLASDTPKENDYVAFLTGGTTLATLDPDSLTITRSDIGTPVPTTLADLVIYNRRAYSLAPEANQIFKHSSTQTGFDAGTAWLKTDTDLSDGISIAIDGDIFVLKSNGDILKFAGGNQESFTISGLDPALTAPTDFYTYNDTDYIYILEPSNKRIVVLDKNGNLREQFISENWVNPTAMIVNEETNEIFVLDNGVVYKFSTRG